MESMREHLRYFFDDVQQIENAPEPEIDESDDIANEPKIWENIGRCKGFG